MVEVLEHIRKLECLSSDMHGKSDVHCICHSLALGPIIAKAKEALKL